LITRAIPIFHNSRGCIVHVQAKIQITPGRKEAGPPWAWPDPFSLNGFSEPRAGFRKAGIPEGVTEKIEARQKQ